MDAVCEGPEGLRNDGGDAAQSWRRARVLEDDAGPSHHLRLEARAAALGLDKYARMRGRAASVHAGTRRAFPRSEPATKSHVSVIFCPPAIFQHPDTAVQVVCGLR